MEADSLKKFELRRRARKIVSSLVMKEDKDRLIIEKLFDFLNRGKFKLVGGFAPLPGEPNLEALYANVKGVWCFPLENPSGELEFHQSHFKDLVLHKLFGIEILAPKALEPKKPEAILVPGMGFDSLGGRLGRGKGYFDKFLENYKGLKVGICYQEQILEKVPMDKHDIKMDIVLTDKHIYEKGNVL